MGSVGLLKKLEISPRALRSVILRELRDRRISLRTGSAKGLKNFVKYGNEILPLHFIQGQNDSVGRFFNSPAVSIFSQIGWRAGRIIT